MEILIFSWRDPKHPLAGGAEQVVHEHCKGWIKAGHSVTLFTSYFKNGLKEERLDGVKIIRRGVQLLGVHILGFFWYVFGKHEKFDLVIDQFHGIPFFTPLYIRRVKKLAILQEVTKEIWLKNHLPAPLNWIIGLIGYTVEPFFFIPYKKIPFITGSKTAKDDLERFGIPGKNITIVNHGVITKIPQPIPVREGIKTIIYLGALARDKGVEEAMRTFGILNQKGQFQFWIVGKGAPSYQERLKSFAKSEKIINSTSFFGFVDMTKKFNLLARAHLLINPSLREGWGLVNIEANSVGTPIVAYKNPGLVDSVKDGFSGVLTSENTPRALAETILLLLSDEERYKALSESSIKWANTFSWKKSTKQSLKLIENLSG